MAATKTVTAASRKVNLQVEDLEGRDLMANYLILDFTPDRILGERYIPGSFRGNYTVRYANGQAPQFLDMNRNGVVNSNDAAIAANAITSRVQTLLAGYNIQVIGTDYQRDTSAGARWLRWGLARPNDLVSVIYVGGYNTTGRDGVTGIAGIANPGENLESYGYAFTASTARHLAQAAPHVSPQYFVNSCAKTVAHEFGHLMGLGHIYGHPQNDPGQNIMNYSSNPDYAHFTNAWYYIEHGGRIGTQNTAEELAWSLSGYQPSRAYAGGYSSYVMGSTNSHHELSMTGEDHHAESGHGHGHCCCGGCRVASEAAFGGTASMQGHESHARGQRASEAALVQLMGSRSGSKSSRSAETLMVG